jgi:hypothetical protein
VKSARVAVRDLGGGTSCLVLGDGLGSRLERFFAIFGGFLYSEGVLFVEVCGGDVSLYKLKLIVDFHDRI